MIEYSIFPADRTLLMFTSANRIAKYMNYNKAQAGLLCNHNNVKIMEFGKLLMPQAPKHLPDISVSPPGSSPTQKLKG